MPYYKFGQNDIFNNTIEAHPKCEFLIHDRKIYFNKYNSEPSSHSSEPSTTSVRHVPTGYISLYEINIDRKESEHGGTVSPTLAYQFTTKEGGGAGFRTVSSTTYAQSSYGDVFTGSYPLSSSLSVERYVGIDDCNNIPSANNLSRPRMSALKNTLNHYKPLSNSYDFSNFDDDKEVTLVSIPSIFYGSSIEKGSVSLKYYITGSLAGELQDIKRNGELVQVSGIEEHNGKVAGVVLYNEGFMALTGSWTLDEDTSEKYNWCSPEEGEQCDKPRWKYWGQLGNPDDEPSQDQSPYASGDPTTLFHLNNNTTEECSSGVTLTVGSNVSFNTTDTDAFSGTSGFIDLPGAVAPTSAEQVIFVGGSGASDLSMTGAFTVDFWFHTDFAGSNDPAVIYGAQNLIRKGDPLTTGTDCFSLAYSGDYPLNATSPTWADQSRGFFLTHPTDCQAGVYAKLSVVADQWYHIALTRDGSNDIRIFIDGVAKDWFTHPMMTSGAVVNLGKTISESNTWDFDGLVLGGGWQYFPPSLNGGIDEFRIVKGTAETFSAQPQSPHTCPTSGTVNTGDCKSSNAPYSSFDLSFNGTSYIPTVTMLAHAKKGELNHSNNPTFLTKGQSDGMIYGTGSLYAEDSELAIKNTVKSPYDGHDASFQKQTWISQIGIYDDDKNLIAIAKLANPVRKTEDREFTFKLKLDI